MSQEYEQMEFDTRGEFQKAIEDLVDETIRVTMRMIDHCATPPEAVRNRHEAYGIAAQHLAEVSGGAKMAKNSAGTMLATLSDPNKPAIEAASSMALAFQKLVALTIIAAAEMKRATSDLYDADISERTPTPMEELAAGFEDAEDRTEYEYEEGDDE